MSNINSLFNRVVLGSSTRHLLGGCRYTMEPESSVMLALVPDFRQMKACPACMTRARASLLYEDNDYITVDEQVVRCDACAAWVRPGNVCSTCGTAAAMRVNR